MRIKYLLALVLVVSFSYGAYALTETAPYTVASSDAGYAVPTGYRIVPTVDIQVTSITKQAGQASINTAYILSSSKTVLASASFSGNSAVLGSPYTLTAGTTYYIAANSTSGLYTLLRQTSVSYPVAGTAVNWTGGLGQSAGAPVDVSNIAYVINSFNYTAISDSFTISAQNIYNSTPLTSFTAVVNGTTYNTTNGTIVMPYSVNETLNATISATNYFSTTTTLTANTSNVETLYPYTAVRVNALTGGAASSFNAYYINNANSSEYGTVSSTNKVAWLPLFNATYEVTVTNVTNGTAYFANGAANITADPYEQSYNFSVYLSNTVVITFYDETSGALLDYTNITVYLTGSQISYNFTTSNGIVNQSLLNPQNYTITYSAPGYDQRNYYIDLTNNTVQIINLYLINSSSTTLVLVSVLDTSSSKVQGATIYLNKRNLSGTNYYTVDSCRTDANGQCLINPVLYNTTYNILIVYEGLTRYQSGDTQISQTSLLFVINTGAEALDYYFEIANIQADLVTTKVLNNTVAKWTATYVNPSLEGMAFMLQVFGIKDNAYTELYAVNGTGTSGTLTYNRTITTTYDELEGRLYYIDSQGNYILLESGSIITGSFQERMGALGLFLFGFLFLGVVAFASLSAGISTFLIVTPLIFTVMQIVEIGAIGWTGVAFVWLLAALTWSVTKK